LLVSADSGVNYHPLTTEGKFVTQHVTMTVARLIVRPHRATVEDQGATRLGAPHDPVSCVREQRYRGLAPGALAIGHLRHGQRLSGWVVATTGMQDHYWEEATGYEVKISKGFSELKPIESYTRPLCSGMKKKWAGKLYYVDLFAGPGKCLIRETRGEIDGSPLIALKFNFAKYFFVESDEKCYRALAARVKIRAPEKEKDVDIIPGDCNDMIGKIRLPPASLGLAFIDPTGVSPLAFETIRKLAENRKVDLIINFHEGMGDQDESPTIHPI
jgi:hypothetical protein